MRLSRSAGYTQNRITKTRGVANPKSFRLVRVRSRFCRNTSSGPKSTATIFFFHRFDRKSIGSNRCERNARVKCNRRKSAVKSHDRNAHFGRLTHPKLTLAALRSFAKSMGFLIGIDAATWYGRDYENDHGRTVCKDCTFIPCAKRECIVSQPGRIERVVVRSGERMYMARSTEGIRMLAHHLYTYQSMDESWSD